MYLLGIFSIDTIFANPYIKAFLEKEQKTKFWVFCYIKKTTMIDCNLLLMLIKIRGYTIFIYIH